MTAPLNTTNRQCLKGQGAFVRAAAAMLSGSRSCLIALRLEPFHAQRGMYVHDHEDQVHPGEGGVDA